MPAHAKLMTVGATISALFAERLLRTVEELGFDTRALWRVLGVTRAQIVAEPLRVAPTASVLAATASIKSMMR